MPGRKDPIPPLNTLKGVQYYAKGSDGQWHYVNHAGTWVACPPPFEPPGVDLHTEAAQFVAEHLMTGEDNHVSLPADGAVRALCDFAQLWKERLEVSEEQRAQLLRTADFRKANNREINEANAKAEHARWQVEHLRDEMLQVMATLAAALSLLERGGKQAVASDKMFEQMMRDYNRSLSQARSTLRKMEALKEEKADG